MTSVDVPVALLGYGTVGAAVHRLLEESADEIERSTLQSVKLRLDSADGESPQQVVDRFGELADAGAQHVIFSVRDVWKPEALGTVIEEILPHLRDL